MATDKNFTSVPSFEITYKTLPIGTNTLMHYHNGYEIVLYIKSSLSCFVKNSHYNISDSSVLFLNPYDMHTLEYTPNTIYTRYVLYFHEDFIKPLLSFLSISTVLDKLSNSKPQIATLNPTEFTKLINLFSTLHKYSEDINLDEATKNSIILNYLSIILTELCMIYTNSTETLLPTQTKWAKIVSDIILYIDKNYADKITLDNIKDLFFIDKFYMCHIFKQSTGISIVDYLQKRRIIESQKLLLGSSLSILDISFDCGFNSLQHFYKIFKKHSNITPCEYRTLHRKI